MQLCQSDRRAEPEEVVVCYVGSLMLRDVNTLFDHLLQEIQRQLQPNLQGRIMYRFVGGDDKRGETHNCLTWLHYVMKELISKDFGIPRSAFDFLVVNPVDILPAKIGLFVSDLPGGVNVISTQGWGKSMPLAEIVRPK